MASAVQSFVTPSFHGYSVQFSPFARNSLTCVGGQHYGISGHGTLLVLQLTEEGIRLNSRGEWKDNLFCAAWSENSEQRVASGGGDGSIQLWDLASGRGQPDGAITPAKVLQEHGLEVSDMSWSCPRGAPQHLLSASWDGSVKLWDVEAAASQSLRTFSHHSRPVYSCRWSPHTAGMFATVAGDGMAALCDARSEVGIQNVFTCHQAEVLCCDWNKYIPHLLVTGSVDGTVRCWDIRQPSRPQFFLQGHKLAVKQVRCSPHHRDRYVSSSYDCTVRVWSAHGESGIGHASCLQEYRHHKEFVYGLDCSLHVPGLVADCSWDSTVNIYECAALAGA